MRVLDLLCQRLEFEDFGLFHLRGDASIDVCAEFCGVSHGEFLGRFGGFDFENGVDIGDGIFVLESLHIFFVLFRQPFVIAHPMHLLELQQVAVGQQVTIAIDGDDTIGGGGNVIDGDGADGDSIRIEAEEGVAKIGEHISSHSCHRRGDESHRVVLVGTSLRVGAEARAGRLVPGDEIGERHIGIAHRDNIVLLNLRRGDGGHQTHVHVRVQLTELAEAGLTARLAN